MSDTRKHRKNSVSDFQNVRSHHDYQSGESCAKKTVKHGDRMDSVRDGRSHRINNKRVTSSEEQNSSTNTNSQGQYLEGSKYASN